MTKLKGSTHTKYTYAHFWLLCWILNGWNVKENCVSSGIRLWFPSESQFLSPVRVFCPGEDVYISLYGACEELSVHLEPDFVQLTKTYISLSTVNRTVSLINRSDLPLKYCWMTEEALSRFVCRKWFHTDTASVHFLQLMWNKVKVAAG